MTKVMAHGCESKQQDKLHGIGMRVFNKTAKDYDWRCTCCGKEITKGGDSKKK